MIFKKWLKNHQKITKPTLEPYENLRLSAEPLEQHRAQFCEAQTASEINGYWSWRAKLPTCFHLGKLGSLPGKTGEKWGFTVLPGKTGKTMVSPRKLMGFHFFPLANVFSWSFATPWVQKEKKQGPAAPALAVLTHSPRFLQAKQSFLQKTWRSTHRGPPPVSLPSSVRVAMTSFRQKRFRPVFRNKVPRGRQKPWNHQWG